MAEYITLEIPADLKYLALLGDTIGAFMKGTVENAEAFVYNVQLAANEICTNVIVHAYDSDASGRVSVRMERNSAQLVIQMADAGRSFNPDAVAAPDLDQPQEGGYGLFLANELMDSVSYTAGDSQNVWVLEKSLDAS